MARSTLEAQAEDILGFGPPVRVPNRRGRPTKAVVRRAAQVLEGLVAARKTEAVAPVNDDISVLGIADVQHGVSIGTLSQIFGMDPTTIRKRLRDCPAILRRKAGYLYDMKVAAQYLVTPVFDIEEYMKTMRPADLPTHLQEAYWSAMRKKQQWEVDARRLWLTEDVVRKFGEVFQHIKFAMQLWPDNVERAIGITPEQRTLLIGMGDALQKEIHEKLIGMQHADSTPSSLGEAVHEPTKPEQIETEESDASYLI